MNTAQGKLRHQSTKWYPIFFPLGKYRNWNCEMVAEVLVIKGQPRDGRYRVQIIKPSTFETIMSEVAFGENQTEAATAYAHGLIDWEESFNVLGQNRFPETPF